LHDLQSEAIQKDFAEWGYWGTQPSKYTGWASHSNRLIPVYTFGIDLNSVRGEHSPYRSRERLEQLYGYLPDGTLNPKADYFDQTDIYALQKSAADQGKKRIILFIFDGMDWQTTWAAAIYRAREVRYREGRGSGLWLQDYRGAATDFGYMVTSPHNEGTKTDVDAQIVLNPGGKMRGGYDWQRGGDTPWAEAAEPGYLISKDRARPHAYTDSASSATAMTAGIKTYNDALNVDPQGRQVETIAQKLQREGWAVGAVTSVPLSHATPAAAYANNVFRDDYQDIARDMVGLRSISHRDKPLPGMDVVIGTGWSETADRDKAQGQNFVPGNKYIADADLATIDVRSGGKYRVVQRTSGVSGKVSLAKAAAEAASNHQRLLGIFGATGKGQSAYREGGIDKSHLPYSTAEVDYKPAIGLRKSAEQYSEAELKENPKLSDVAAAALDVLSKNEKGFWLMIEAGDVDWANHDDNIDNSIGAALDGDDAVHAVTDWIESHGGWKDTVLIVTSDHGHYFHLTDPEAIARAAKSK
jgi:alkaline phosphatase